MGGFTGRCTLHVITLANIVAHASLPSSRDLLAAPTGGFPRAPGARITPTGKLPLAAVLAFIDPGLVKDADCVALLADAKVAGVPVDVPSATVAPRPVPH